MRKLRLATMLHFLTVILVFNSLLNPVLAKDITSTDPSAYIRMHVNDAVKWQQWSPAILDRARSENKMIFISSGFYACHWCHVMRKESFMSADVAHIINKYFIPVKIDREISVSLDNYLIDFLRSTQGRAGWPLNIFITPEGYPLTGFVYLPKEELKGVLQKISIKWNENSDNLRKIASDIYEQSKQASYKLVDITEKQKVILFESEVKKGMDDLEGGFGNTIKIPKIHLMNAVISLYEKNKNQDLAEFINLTLEQMLVNGLHDAISGGFFRYTVDQSWQTPHFEKMLYVNASMISLYLRAYRVFENRRWLDAAKETVNFVSENMKREDGFYTSSISAQGINGVEGENYFWEREQIKNILGERKIKFLKNRVSIVDYEEDKVLINGFINDPEGAAIKKLLYSASRERKLVKDSKIVISWNAYLTGSIIEYMQVSGDKQYVNDVDKNINNLKGLYKENIKSVYYFNHIDDYVYTADAIWRWNKYKNRWSDEGLVIKLIDDAVTNFRLKDGWKNSITEVLPRPGVSVHLKDGALPSAEIVLEDLVKGIKKDRHGLIDNDLIDYFNINSFKVSSKMLNAPLRYASFFIRD